MPKKIESIINFLSKDRCILFFLTLIMLYLRIVPNFQNVFTSWPGEDGSYVNFACDDAVYHMRLVHNTIKNFPWRIFFDPFTHFPYGSQIHFGPLFTLLIASISFLLGLGHPNPHLINTVGAFVPPLLGALCLFPTYYIAKKIFGKNAGILAALTLACLPGEFFHRSTLGFTDHHIAEVFFSTLLFAFLVKAISLQKEISKLRASTIPITFHDNLLPKTRKKSIALLNKTNIKFSSFAGLAFGLYLLTWPAAPLVGAILFLFFFKQLIINQRENENSNQLLITLLLVFIFPIIMVLPYALLNPHLDFAHYSLTQPLVLLAMLILLVLTHGIFLLMNKSSCFIKILHKKKFPHEDAIPSLQKNWLKSRYFFLLAPLSLTLITIAILIIFPNFYQEISSGIKLLFKPKPGMLTVAEVWPSILDRETSLPTFDALEYNFLFAFPFGVLSLALLLEKIWSEKNHPLDLLIIIWSIIMMIATFLQIRFAYYFAICAAILTGHALSTLLDHLNPIFRSSILIKHRRIKTICFFILFFSVTLMICYPATSLAPKNLLHHGERLNQKWHQAFTWIRNKTPPLDPLNYDAFYKIPKYKKSYDYPLSSYGIMNWWPAGHQITYLAKRIPVSNPFQEGIIEKNGFGAAPFFTAEKEQDALENMEKTKARYVFIENSTAKNQYYAMLIWMGEKNKNAHEYRKINWQNHAKKNKLNLPFDSKDFQNSMLNKLYYHDGLGLEHFRLIYESEGKYIVNLKSLQIKTGKINDDFKIKNENFYAMQKLYNRAQNLTWRDNKKDSLIYDARPPAQDIKIFEKVKGAVIIGTIPKSKIKKNILVNLNLPLMTKSGRIFTYTQDKITDEFKYEFIVPYPTKTMRGKDYEYDILPLSSYLITYGSQKNHVNVTEKNVMQGEKVYVKK